MSFRLEKIAKLIKEEISLIFLHKIQDTSIGLVTLSYALGHPRLPLNNY